MANSQSKNTISTKEKISFFIKKATTKKGMTVGGSIFGLFLFVLLIVKACEPAKGTILYGICGAFLEQQIPFPETIEHTYVEQYGWGVRIYYNHIDAFGQHLNEFLECSFDQQPESDLYLKAVIFSTIKEVTEKTPIKNKGRLYAVEQKYIDKFNKSNSIQIIMNQDIDLTLPYETPLAF